MSAINSVTWSTSTSGIAVPTTSTPATDLIRLPEVSAERSFLNNGNSVFWSFLNMLGAGESATQPQYWWFEDDKHTTVDTVKAAVASTSTTTVTVDGTSILPRSTVRNMNTNEIYYVSAVSGDSLTIVRGAFGSTAVNIGEDDVLITLATNLPEGADAGEAIGSLPTKTENYVTVYSTTVKATDMQELSNMRFNAGKRADNYTKSMNWIMEQMDNQLRFGVKGVQTVGGNAVYSTGGFRDLVGSAVSMTGIDTRAEWRAMLLPYFQHTASSPRKVLMGGSDVVNNLIASQVAATTVSPTKFDPVLGANITTIDLGGGMIVDVVMDLQGFSTARGLNKQFFLIDPAHVKLRPYTGMEGLVSRDVTRAESHTVADEIFGSTGLELNYGAENIHAWGIVA